MLSRGRIVADASPEELARQSARMVVHFGSDLPAEAYANLAGVLAADRDGDGIRLAAQDSDAAIADLVSSGLPFHNLTTTAASLEDAFVHIATTEEEVLA